MSTTTSRPSAASSNAERQSRITEALLLTLVLLILLTGSALVATAKQRDAPQPGAVLDVNHATAPELAHALSIPAVFADRVVAERTRLHGFEDVDAIGRIPLVSAPRVAAETLRQAGFPLPQSAAPGEYERIDQILKLDKPTAARFAVLHAALPKAKRWENVLSAPLVSSGQVTAVEPHLSVRPFAQGLRQFLVADLALAVFFVGTHLILRKTRPGADPYLLPTAALLSVLGVLVLFSLKDPVRDMAAYWAQTQGIILGGGIALLVSLSGRLGRLPLHRYGYLYAIAAVIATIILGFAGVGPAGVRLAVAGVQPIEGIKILLAFFLAAYLAERAPVLNDKAHRFGPFALPHRADIFPLLVLYAIPLALFAYVRDLGPVLLLYGMFLILLYLATGRAAYVLAGFAGLVLGAFIGYRLHFGVFYVRVDMWLSPWHNLHKGGEQTACGLWGLASGGFPGSGLGLGATHLIPRGGSDLAFASLGEEMGIIGTVVVVLCLAVIIARGFRIARTATTDFDRYLAAGISTLLCLQALLIVCGTLNLLPLAGITVPFVSHGKSSLIACFFSIGTLLAISAQSRPGTTAATNNDLLAAPPEFRRAAGRLAFVGAICLVPLILVRLVWLQVFTANATSGRSVSVPDADNIVRSHKNPRLTQIAARIDRGMILDRNGMALAETVSGVRTYPLGAATPHWIGYVDPAVGGPTGLERRYDAEMRGYDNFSDLVGLWRAKDLPGFHMPSGQNITLTLDADLQKASLAALSNGAKSVHDPHTGKIDDRGALVVIDVATGGILASISLPVYDPAKLSPATMHTLLANSDKPFLDRANRYYPPGSTFKIVTASGLLAQKKSDLTVNCQHTDANVYWKANGITYARRRITDDEGDRPHGTIGMDDAIAQSCNVYFAHAGLALGGDALRQIADQFKFNRLPSAIDFGASLPDIAYGQGPMLVSPTEMAGVVQTVANGGVRLQPAYRRDRLDAHGAPILPAADAARLSSALLRVTQSGTAAGKFGGLPFAVAGKTGTAQNTSGDKVAHSWFVGFAPADRPRIAFAVIVENGGYGAQVAVPIADHLLHTLPPNLMQIGDAK